MNCFFCGVVLDPEAHEHDHMLSGQALCRCAGCKDPSPAVLAAALKRLLVARMLEASEPSGKAS